MHAVSFYDLWEVSDKYLQRVLTKDSVPHVHILQIVSSILSCPLLLPTLRTGRGMNILSVPQAWIRTYDF